MKNEKSRKQVIVQDDRHHGPGVPAVLEPLRRGLPQEDGRGVGAVGVFVEFVLPQRHGDRGTLQVKRVTHAGMVVFFALLVKLGVAKNTGSVFLGVNERKKTRPC